MIARTFPVKRVASQGKDLAPKARRTKGTRKTKTITLAGRAKKKICKIVLERVFLKLIKSFWEASSEREGKEAWDRETPKSRIGKTYSWRAKLKIESDPTARNEVRLTATHLSIWSKPRDSARGGMRLNMVFTDLLLGSNLKAGKKPKCLAMGIWISI